MSKHDLFSEFNPVTAKAWKQKIQVDLKGADYNNTLIWKSPEQIHVKPFYNSEDLKPETYSPNTKATTWTINEHVYVNNETSANNKAQSALKKGASAITFSINTEQCNIDLLLKDLDLASTDIYFQLSFLSSDFVMKLDEFAFKNAASFYVSTDIIGRLAESGNWYTTLQNDHANLERILDSCSNLKSSVSVNMSLYQNAGATCVQQLAYGLAHANEYLNYFKNQTNTLFTFKVAVGSNYFFEISKLRALRLLWQTLASEYQNNTNCHIVAYPTSRNKTIYDYNTNMLRSTTECMSAILGGANSISNTAYDSIFHKTNEFGSRIARNQLLILKHESYFDKVNNPSDGSYYIESLTQQLAEKALQLFKDIEAYGGFLNQLKEGIIQKKIKESALKEQDDFNTGKVVLVGTNKYPNTKDSMKDNLELYPFLKNNPRKTLIEPILSKRLAETYEQERLKHEQH